MATHRAEGEQATPSLVHTPVKPRTLCDAMPQAVASPPTGLPVPTLARSTVVVSLRAMAAAVLGEHIMVCPSCNNPGMRENAKKNVDRMKANCQKHARQNTKRKNLGTANFADFDTAGQDCIREQVLLTLKNGNREISDTTSVASSVMTSSVIPAASRGQGQDGNAGGRGRIFIVDVTILAMPIAIHSNLPHIIMQFGPILDCPHSPSICCAVDSCNALSNGNFHYFASLAIRFPHCLAKVFAPRIIHQSCCGVSSSPSSKKPSPPSWRWASNSTSPTRHPKGRMHLS